MNYQSIRLIFNGQIISIGTCIIHIIGNPNTTVEAKIIDFAKERVSFKK